MVCAEIRFHLSGKGDYAKSVEQRKQTRTGEVWPMSGMGRNPREGEHLCGKSACETKDVVFSTRGGRCAINTVNGVKSMYI
jgi:hypothetical protein